MTITAERFATGLTFEEYMAQMKENKEKFAANYESFQIAPADRAFVCEFEVPLKVLIITEDWCGDALTYLPVLGRLCACAENWDLRVFLRDQNLDLADQYLNQGRWRSVPVVVFFDSQMRELGRFIERPALANQERQAAIDGVAREHSEVHAGASYNEQTDAGKEAITPALRELRQARKEAWQHAAVAEVMEALHKLTAGAHRSA